jgi:hypothetical protein
MSHHIRFFRFSNRTHIEKSEDLQFDEFFDGDDKREFKLLKQHGPKKSEDKILQSQQFLQMLSC